jgi:thioredoxin-like negative regulator of GroEL
VVGQICHIYAASDNGPRGKPRLTATERNSPENLILMCGHHHPLVDKQWETYPADLLKAWKEAHQAQFQQGTAEALKLQASIQQLGFLQTYSDQQIALEIVAIRQGRFINGYPGRQKVAELTERIERTELAGGSSEIRAKGLAWCARLMCQPETLDRAHELLEKSKGLAETSEAQLAEAFIVAVQDKDAALALLAPMNTPAARSAALRIVTNSEQVAGAIGWVERAGLTFDSFDAEGKFFHITNELTAGRWQEAADHASQVTIADTTETPVLDHVIGMACLMQAVPVELRPTVLSQIPFEVASFPLAADPEALAYRRRAIKAFEAVSAFALNAGVAGASNLASDLALWLKLRDPQGHDGAMEELRESMRDPAQSLRRLPFALQFGLKLDLATIEKEIDRRVALSGRGRVDEAVARFALAFMQGDPKGTAEYIARHRGQLYEHIHKSSIQIIEIEMLARAGQIGTAKERLADAISDGLGANEQQHLGRVIAETEGADPAAERRRQYEETGRLIDLGNLVALLEQEESWQELLPFAERLFGITHALEDAFRVAKALNQTGQYDELLLFLRQNSTLVEQAVGLKTMLAWSLFRHGRFDEASSLLGELVANRDDANDRALRVNLAIASGKWEELIEHSTSEWNKREERTAAELLMTAQIAQAVGGPHAKDLVRAAAEKAPAEADIVIGAYIEAASAGWEGESIAGGWLQRAAALSGEDGPVKRMTMKEVLDRKPEWDRRATSVWQHLNEGKVPMFGAAHLLHRSLIDFTLLQALANLPESDARRRDIIYAFSGVRPAVISLPSVTTIALDLTAIFTLALLELLPVVISAYQRIAIPHSTLGWLFQERQRATFHQPSRIKEAHDLKRLVAEGGLKVLPSQPLSDLTLAKEVGLQLTRLLSAASKAKASDGMARYVIRPAPVHRVGSLMEEEADLSAHSEYLYSCQSLVEKLRAKGVLTLDEEQRALAYLKLHERRWTSEPKIADGAEIYLDDLATTYLQTVGVLAKFKAAGLVAYITEDDDKDANRLVSYENLSDQQLELIELIRKTLSEGLRSGRVIAVKSPPIGDEKLLGSHPTFSVLGIEDAVDALVIDDRCVNQHPFMEAHNRRTPILSTLDLLKDLASKGAISEQNVFAHRTYLRRAGFQFMPVTEEELLHYLADAPLNDGDIVETAEPRAVRESLLMARMRKILQIPAEMAWLHESARSVSRSIRGLWKTGADLDESAIRAEWLLGLLDVRGWAPAAVPGNERSIALFAHAAHLQSLMLPPDNAPDSVRNSYYDWIDRRLFQEMRDSEPEGFGWIVDRAREFIVDAAETAVRQLGA